MSDETLAKTMTSQLQSALSGRYQIGRLLGEGGMAVVFEATDLKHDRQVAVKVLRPELSAVLGADRFLREIRVTAKLQHPHILPLYDSGAAGELLYYVMPLVQGESLRDRLSREREMPVSEAIAAVKAIAGALDYAHRQGVLHRDIKPEDILLHDGQPMLADFGIALAVSSAGASRLTQTGLSVGTPTYMSPEQMSGERPLDGRSDIFALACVAYETLAGVPPFAGSSVQAVVAAVMLGATKPLTTLRSAVPEPAAAAIHQALASVPADRFATAAEFAEALTADTRARRVAIRTRLRRGTVAWAGLAAVLGMAVGIAAYRMLTPAPEPPIRHWNIVLPDEARVALAGAGSSAGPQTAIALSPEGDRLAYVATTGATTVLAERQLVNDSTITFTGTEGAYHPFFSPDGAWIGFFSGNFLRKVPARGGDAITLAQVNRITGAHWSSDNQIFVLENEGFELHRISPSGLRTDSVVLLTTQFGTSAELPGGDWAVGQLSSGQLALLSLASGTELAITRRGVVPLDSVRQSGLLFGTSPHWLPNGYLLFATGDGVLMAMPFDGKRRRVLGEPVPVATGVRMEAGFGYADFTVSREGTIIYVPGGNQLYVNIAFLGPNGQMDTLPFPRGQYTQPRLSPDGTRLAVQARNPIGGWEVLLMDLLTGVRQKVDVEGNYRAFPASWLPGGTELMIGLWDPVQFLNYGARVQSLETGKWRDINLKGASYMTVAPDGSQFVFNDWRTGDRCGVRLAGPAYRRHLPGG